MMPPYPRVLPEGFLFASCEYDFCEGGVAYDRLVGGIGRKCKNPYVFEYSPETPADAGVYWLWDDDTMSLASDEIQEEYRAWVASLVVGVDP